MNEHRRGLLLADIIEASSRWLRERRLLEDALVRARDAGISDEEIIAAVGPDVVDAIGAEIVGRETVSKNRR